MDFQRIKEYSSLIGNWLGIATERVIYFLSSLGVKINSVSAKMLNIFILVTGIFIIIKLLTGLKTFVKYLLIILFVALLLSTAISFIR